MEVKRKYILKDWFGALQQWRDEDHEDVLVLTRNDVIELIEAYKDEQFEIKMALTAPEEI